MDKKMEDMMEVMEMYINGERDDAICLAQEINTKYEIKDYFEDL